MKEQLYKFVASVIQTECGVDKELVSPNAMIKNDLLISSLDFVNIITIIEEQYDLELPDEVLIIDEDISLKDFCDKLCRLLDKEENNAR